MNVLTCGTFDLFHWGHVNFLRSCQKVATYSGKVTVLLNRDEFVAKYKEKPVMNTLERQSVLLACAYVDEVVINKWDDKLLDFIKKTKPDIYLVGSDWATKDYHKQIGVSRQDFADLKITFGYIEYTEGISSTLIKERFK